MAHKSWKITDCIILSCQSRSKRNQQENAKSQKFGIKYFATLINKTIQKFGIKYFATLIADKKECFPSYNFIRTGRVCRGAQWSPLAPADDRVQWKRDENASNIAE